MDHLCYLCLVLVMLLRLFIAALWSPVGKGQTSWLSFVMFNCVFVTFPCGILGLFDCFVALRPKSTAMVIAGRSVYLSTLFPGQA